MAKKFDTDLPYLEDLILFIRQDKSLENYFSKKDLFAEPKVAKDVEKIIEGDCPAPRSLLIIPSQSIPLNNQKVANCNSPMLHTFHVLIFIQCVRDYYQFLKDDEGNVFLGGEVVQLAAMRKAVKESINNFSKKVTQSHNFGYNDINWVSDESIDKEGSFLVAQSLFEIKIY